MIACLRGNTGAVQVLLENGADVTQREQPTNPNLERLNCLELAIENGRRFVNTCHTLYVWMHVNCIVVREGT